MEKILLERVKGYVNTDVRLSVARNFDIIDEVTAETRKPYRHVSVTRAKKVYTGQIKQEKDHFRLQVPTPFSSSPSLALLSTITAMGRISAGVSHNWFLLDVSVASTISRHRDSMCLLLPFAES